MARPKKKYHYIYKTTCNLNGKYYIGMHSTSNLEDGYMGSGKRLRYSIRKHGIENHTREIVEFLEGRESLAKRESEIVNEELINDPLCMNLKCGGIGGFSNEEHEQKFIEGRKWGRSLGGTKSQEVLKNNPEKRKLMVEKTKTTLKEYFINNPGNFTNCTHSFETIQLMKDSKKNHGIGNTNSQFGTCWITNEVENKKIKKGDLIPEGWRLGRTLK